MGDDPMALLGLEGALKHYYYLLLVLLLLHLLLAAACLMIAQQGLRCKKTSAGVPSLQSCCTSASAALGSDSRKGSSETAWQ
jgi:hypothetical protein